MRWVRRWKACLVSRSPLQGITDDYRPFLREKNGPNTIQYPLGQYTDDTQLTVATVKPAGFWMR